LHFQENIKVTAIISTVVYQALSSSARFKKMCLYFCKMYFAADSNTII